MNTKGISTSIVVVILVILNLTLLATVWYLTQRHLDGAEAVDPVSIWTKELGLNAEQQSTFHKLHDTHRHLVDPIHQSMRSTRRYMIGAFSNDTPPAKLDSLTQALGSQQAMLERHLGELYSSMHSVCDEKQQQRLSRMFLGAVAQQGKHRK